MIRFQIHRPGPAGRTFNTEIGGYPAIVEILPLDQDAPLIINVMTMDAGDQILLENITEPLIGAYLVSGSLIDESKSTLQFDGRWTTEWSGKPRTGLFTAGEGGASWVCLQERPGIPAPSVELMTGSAKIPAGASAVIALSGPIYSKPSSVKRDGDILLVTT